MAKKITSGYYSRSVASREQEYRYYEYLRLIDKLKKEEEGEQEKQKQVQEKNERVVKNTIDTANNPTRQKNTSISGNSMVPEKDSILNTTVAQRDNTRQNNSNRRKNTDDFQKYFTDWTKKETDKLTDPIYPSVLDPIVQSGRALDRLNYQQRHKDYQEYTGDPSTQIKNLTGIDTSTQKEQLDPNYSIWSKQYLADVWSSIGQKMNEAQSEGFAGKLVKSDEIDYAIKEAYEAKDNDDKRELLDQYFNLVDAEIKYNKRSGEVDVLSGIRQSKQSVLQQLRKYYGNNTNELFLFQEQQRLNSQNQIINDLTKKQKLQDYIDNKGGITSGVVTVISREFGKLVHSGNTKEAIENNNIDWAKLVNRAIAGGAAGMGVGSGIGAAVGLFSGGVLSAPGAVIGGVIGTALGALSAVGATLLAGNATSNDYGGDDIENIESLRGFDRMSSDQRKAALNEYNKRQEIYRDYWKAARDKNIQEGQYYAKMHPVSKEFQKRVAQTSDDLWKKGGFLGVTFNTDNLLYKNMDQLGYSMSSWDKQYVSILGSLSGNPISNIAAFLMNQASSEEENNMEVDTNFRQRLSNIISDKLSEDKELENGFMSVARKDLGLDDPNAMKGLSSSQKSKLSKQQKDYVLGMIAEGKYKPVYSKFEDSFNDSLVQAEYEAVQGANNLFNRDMVATTGDNLNTLATYMAGGKALKLGGTILKGSGSVAYKVAIKPLARLFGAQSTRKYMPQILYRTAKTKVLESSLAKTTFGKRTGKFISTTEDFVKRTSGRFIQGMENGSFGGIGISAFSGATRATAGMIKDASKVLYNNKYAQQFVTNTKNFVETIAKAPREVITGAFDKVSSSYIGKKVGSAYALTKSGIKKVGNFAEKIEERAGGLIAKDATTAGKIFLARDLAKAGAKYVGKKAAQLYEGSLSEGIEEGKQWKNGYDWVNGEVPSKVESFFDTLLNDFNVGKQVLTGAIGATLGQRWGICLTLPDSYADITGGIIGGAAHHGPIMAVQSVIETASGQIAGTSRISLDKMIVNNTLVNNTNAVDQYERLSKLAAVVFNDSQGVRETFNRYDDFMARRRDSGKTGYSEDEMKEQRDLLDKVDNFAHNQLNFLIAQANKIDIGSKLYGKIVAAHLLYKDIDKEASDELKKVKKDGLVIKNQLLNLILNRTSTDSFGNEVEVQEDSQLVTRLKKQLGIDPKEEFTSQQLQDVLMKIVQLKVLNGMDDVFNITGTWGNVKRSADSEYVRGLIKKRTDAIKKSLGIHNLPETVISTDGSTRFIFGDICNTADAIFEELGFNKDQIDQLRDHFQEEFGATANKQMSSFMLGELMSKPKELIKLLDKNVDSKYTVIDNIEREFQSRFIREQKEARRRRAVETASQRAVDDFLRGGDVTEDVSDEEYSDMEDAWEQSELENEYFEHERATEEAAEKERLKQQEKQKKIQEKAIEQELREQHREERAKRRKERNNRKKNKKQAIADQEQSRKKSKKNRSERIAKRDFDQNVFDEEYGELENAALERDRIIRTKQEEKKQREKARRQQQYQKKKEEKRQQQVKIAEEDDDQLVQDYINEANDFYEHSKEKEEKNSPTDHTSDAKTSNAEQAYGSNNKVFTKQKLDDALNRLHQIMNRMHSGIDPELIEVGVTIFGYHVEAGLRKFSDVCHAACKTLFDNDFTEEQVRGISQNFKQWYAALMTDENSPINEMDSIDEVRGTDVNVIVNAEIQQAENEGAHEDLKESVIETMLRESGVSLAVTDVTEILNQNELKAGDKFIVVNPSEGTYQQFMVYQTNADGFPVTVIDNQNTVWVSEGFLLSPEQRKYLQEMNNVNRSVDQRTVIDAFNKKIDEDNASVKGLCSYCYFVEVDGKIEIYPRVHTINGDQYAPSERQKRLNTEVKECIDYYKDKYGDSYLEKIIEHILSPSLSEKDILNKYSENNDVETIQTLYDVLRTHKGSKNEDVVRQEVEQVISSELSHINPGISVEIGNVFDQLIRDFFQSGIGDIANIQYDTYYVVLQGKNIPISDIVSKASFDANLIRLQQLGKFFADHGYYISTKEHTFHETVIVNGKPQKVAGTTDIVAINKEGKYCIIDTKTSKRKFLSDVVNGVEVNPFYLKTPLADYSLYDIGIRMKSPDREALRSTYEQYSMQLSMYMQLLKAAIPNAQFTKNPISILPINVDYDYRSAQSAFNDIMYDLPETISTLVYDFNVAHERKAEDMSDKLRLVPLKVVGDAKKLVENQPTTASTTQQKSETKKEEKEEKTHTPTTPTPSTPQADHSNRQRSGWTQYNTADLYSVRDSVCITDQTLRLADVVGNNDFQNATFEVVSSTKDYCVVKPVYNGKEFSPIKIQYAQNSNGVSLRNAVESCLQNDKSNGTKTFLTGMIRTAGQVNIINPFNIINTQYKNKNIRDISTEYGNVEFGLAKLDKDGIVQVTSQNQTGTGRVYIYEFNRGQGSSGVYYQIIRPSYQNADGSTTEPIASPLQTGSLSQFDINTLVWLLQTSSTPTYEITLDNGDTVNLPGVSHADLINLFVSNGTANEKYNTNLHVKQEGGYAVFTWKKTSATDPGTASFNLTTQQGVDECKNFLRSKRFEINQNIVDTRFNDDERNSKHKDTQVLVQIHKFFKQHPNVQSFKIGDSLVFQRNDFISDNQSDKRAISGLAWYMRNGMLLSTFGGLRNNRFSFNNVENQQITQDEEGLPSNQPIPETIEDSKVEDQTPQSKEIHEDTEETNNVEDSDIVDVDFDPLSLDMSFDSTSIANDGERSLTKEEAEQYIAKVFGGKKNVPLVVKESLDDLFEGSTAGAAGCVTKAFIALSTKAKYGVQYHEAFHMVSQYMLPKAIYNSIYKKSKKIMIKRGLLDKDAKDAEQTRRIVEEFAADECMKFFLDRENVLKDLHGPFSYIKYASTMLRNAGSIRLGLLYMSMNSGLYKHVKRNTTSNINRILKDSSSNKFNSFKKNGVTYEHIFDENIYRDCVKSIAYYILNLQKIRPDGYNISELDLRDITKKYRRRVQVKGGKFEIRELTLEEVLYASCHNAAGRRAIHEVMQNWDSVKQDVVDYLNTLNINYTEIQNETERDEQSDYTGNPTSDLEVHIKASYETSRSAKMDKGIRFLFSQIVMYTEDENGNSIPERNSLGLMQFRDPNEVLHQVLSQMHTVRSVEDMLNQFAVRAKTDKTYQQLYNVASGFANNVHYKDKEGKQTKRINYNNEATLTQLYNLISSAQMQFKRLSAVRSKDGMYVLKIEDCGQDYQSFQYRKDWGGLLAFGATPYFTMNENGQFCPKKASSVTTVGMIFDKLQEIQNEYRKVTQSKKEENRLQISGRVIDITNDADAQFVKRKICDCFKALGIQMNKAEFDFMLNTKYSNASSAHEQLQMFMQEDGVSDFSNLWSSNTNVIRKINGTWSWNVIDGNKIADGRNTPVQNIWNRNSFISELSKYKYQYSHLTSELSVLVSGGKKLYCMTDNNLLSDVVNELTDKDDHSLIDQLSKFCYNVIENDEGVTIGSVIAKQVLQSIKDGKQIGIQLCTPVQFKTNDRSDEGSDYFQIGEREDYVMKCSILEGGNIIFPTMSDKKTWYYITGVDMPGIKYTYDNNGNITGISGTLKESVNLQYDQLIEYAQCELAAIEQALEQLKTLPPEKRTKNYYSGASVTDKKGIKHKIANGTIFSCLTGVYDDNGNYVAFNRVLDEDGNYVSPEENIRRAKEMFFDKTNEEKRAILKTIIQKQREKELQHMIDIGIVKKEGMLYKNVGLNNTAITTIAKKIYNVSSANMLTASQISVAIEAYAQDVLLKTIVSINETERIFSGHPGFFKYKFSKDGRLVDRTTDQFKRYGGLVSTGTNNNTHIEGIPENGMYNAAEVNNPMVGSEQIDYITKAVSRGELLATYRNIFGGKSSKTKKLYDDSSKMTNEELREAISKQENGEYLLQQTDQRIERIVSVYRKDDSNEGIDVADGGTYISPQMTEWLLRMCGKFDNEIAKAFKILNDPKADVYKQQEAYHLVTTTVIGAQKYTAYGMRMSSDGKTCIPYYNKMALFPVFKCIATGEFAKIYDKMINNKDENGNPQPIHQLLINSAVKVGSEGAVDYSRDVKFNVRQEPFSRLRKQFNTDPHHKDEQAMGTQMVKVALANLLLQHTYKNGKTGLQIRDEIMNSINRLAELNVKQIREKLYGSDGRIDAKKFSQWLKENLSSRDADESILDSIETIDAPNGTSKLKRPLESLSRMGWFQAVMVAYLNKRICDVNTPGNAFYQRSVWGMEGDASSVMNDDNLPPNINGGQNLKMIIEDGPAKGAMDCVLTIDYFKDFLKEAGLANASFEEQKKALIEAGIIGQNAEALTIGYRIPTQALSSIHPLRCVDVLPVIQHTIILPKEFTRITGSDFDIDKIFIGSMNISLKKGKDGKWINDKNAIQKNPTKATQNHLLQMYIDVMTDEESVNVAHRSIDNDTELFTNKKDGVIAKLDKSPDKVTNEVMPYDAYTLRMQTSTKNLFVGGKDSIGPHALNNNSHILTMLYNVDFPKQSLLYRIGLTSLHDNQDQDGKSILAWIGGLINGSVDNAKDPWIVYLNVGKMTFNMENMLLRAGVGSTTFSFITQPIVEQMAIAYNNSQTSFLKEEGKSLYKIQKDSQYEAACKLCGESTMKSMKNKLFSSKNKKASQEFKDQVREFLIGEDRQLLDDISRGKRGSFDTTVFGRMSYEEVQAFIYYMYQELDVDATWMSNFVKYSKIDTKKQGRNIVEQIAYAQGVYSIFGDDSVLPGRDCHDFHPSVKDLNEDVVDGNEGLANLYSQSFIGYKTRAALHTFWDVCSSQFLEGTQCFQNLLTAVSEKFGRTDVSSMQKISNALRGELKRESILQYCERNNIDIDGLVTGNNTIYDRLNRLVAKISYSDEYAYLRRKDGTIKNALLATLKPGYVWERSQNNNSALQDTFENLKFVQLFDVFDKSGSFRDNIIKSWDSLLTDSHQEIRDFARDLCVYAYITSYDNGGSKRIFQYVPTSWRDSSGYSAACDQLIQEYNDRQFLSSDQVDDLVDRICLNNWRDYTFVPTIKLNAKQINEGDVAWVEGSTQQEEQNRKESVPSIIRNHPSTPANLKEVKPYVKIKISDDDGSNTCYAVYKLKSITASSRNSNKGDVVYVRCNPMGREVNGYTYYRIQDNVSSIIDTQDFSDVVQDGLYNAKTDDKQKPEPIDNRTFDPHEKDSPDISPIDLNNPEAIWLNRDVSDDTKHLLELAIKMAARVHTQRSTGDVQLPKVILDPDEKKYDASTNTIYLPISKDDYFRIGLGGMHTVILAHEIVHSVTAQALNPNTEIGKQYQKIFYEIKEHIAKNNTVLNDLLDKYNITSMDEFLSVIFSSPWFNRLAMETKPIDEKKFDNLLDEIVDIIKRVFERFTKRGEDHYEDLLEQCVTLYVGVANVSFDILNSSDYVKRDSTLHAHGIIAKNSMSIGPNTVRFSYTNETYEQTQERYAKYSDGEIKNDIALSLTNHVPMFTQTVQKDVSKRLDDPQEYDLIDTFTTNNNQKLLKIGDYINGIRLFVHATRKPNKSKTVYPLRYDNERQQVVIVGRPLGNDKIVTSDEIKRYTSSLIKNAESMLQLIGINPKNVCMSLKQDEHGTYSIPVTFSEQAYEDYRKRCVDLLHNKITSSENISEYELQYIQSSAFNDAINQCIDYDGKINYEKLTNLLQSVNSIDQTSALSIVQKLQDILQNGEYKTSTLSLKSYSKTLLIALINSDNNVSQYETVNTDLKTKDKRYNLNQILNNIFFMTSFSLFDRKSYLTGMFSSVLFNELSRSSFSANTFVENFVDTVKDTFYRFGLNAEDGVKDVMKIAYNMMHNELPLYDLSDNYYEIDLIRNNISLIENYIKDNIKGNGVSSFQNNILTKQVLQSIEEMLKKSCNFKI